MRRLLARLALVAGHGLAAAQPATVKVDFRLTAFESTQGIAGAEVRLALGAGSEVLQPAQGHRFTTDAEGRARFTLQVPIDRRWISVPVAQTGLSVPKRADHLRIALELDQALPQADGRQPVHRWLHLLDIDCLADGSCASHDIVEVFAADTHGQWTRPLRFGRVNADVPELGGLALSGPGYRLADFQLTPEGSGRSQWTLRLWLQRRPAPVRR